MECVEFWQLATLPDAQLRSDLGRLLASGYHTEARIIAHLAEVEQRKLHLKDGSESLYDYCTRGLRLSNSEAFHRITAARIARQFPIVFRLLEQRKLHLTAVCLLRDYLTPDNHQQLLADAVDKTKWQVQELLARRFPRPDVESRVRKLPTPRPTTATVAVPQGMSSPHAAIPLADAEGLPLNGQLVPAQPAPAQPAPAQPAPARRSFSSPPRMNPVPVPIQPVSEARYRIQLNASSALKEKLDRLRALTSHSNPSGDLAVLIERALDLAIEQAERQRFAKSNRPRAPRQAVAQTKSNGLKPEQVAAVETTHRAARQRAHIPNAVLREVAERDGFQCSYRGADGCRCTARAFLQVHHERPWARGGRETVGNLRLLCAAHNQLLAERDFGAHHVELRRRERERQAERDRGADRRRG